MNQPRHFLVSRPFRVAWTLALVVLMLLPVLHPAGAAQAQSGDVGYRDFSFPNDLGDDEAPTSEKPESKLWFTDGSWYGTLWSAYYGSYTIHRFNPGSQSWTDTGVLIDDRLLSKADALWDGNKLYIASHIFVTSGATAPAGERGELYRYSYNQAGKTFSLDAGFPVEVTRGKSETLVIDKDSTGTLWVTYVEGRKVMVNHSQGSNHLAWGTPFQIPGSGTLNSDDISSLIAYNGYIGVMWSNQASSSAKRMYFAVHQDGAADTTWTTVSAYGASGDDHINLKTLQADSAGNVFAVIKTSNNAALVVVLVCKNNGNRCRSVNDWSAHLVYNSVKYNPTRPMMMIDESNRHLYVFTRNEPGGSGEGGIYYKRANLDNINFDESSLGTPFINNEIDFEANDPTSTKQNVNATTGLLILASDPHTRYYLHNYISLGGTPPPPAPAISSISPSSGPVGTEVTINGSNLNGATAVTLNNLPVQSFNVDSAARIRAVVPQGAVSGQFRVTTPGGMATSSAAFTVTTTQPAPPTISGFTPSSGQIGSFVTINGSNFNGVTAVTFNNQPAQTVNAISPTMLQAVVPQGATSGRIRVVTPAGTATSSSNFNVLSTSQLGEHTYLPDITR